MRHELPVVRLIVNAILLEIHIKAFVRLHHGHRVVKAAAHAFDHLEKLEHILGGVNGREIVGSLKFCF